MGTTPSVFRASSEPPGKELLELRWRPRRVPMRGYAAVGKPAGGDVVALVDPPDRRLAGFELGYANGLLSKSK